MSEHGNENVESIVDGLVEVAGTWFQVGVTLAQTAISVAADGLQATAAAISMLGDEVEGSRERTS